MALLARGSFFGLTKTMHTLNYSYWCHNRNLFLKLQLEDFKTPPDASCLGIHLDGGEFSTTQYTFLIACDSLSHTYTHTSHRLPAVHCAVITCLRLFTSVVSNCLQ